jgi:hypothetical protein
MYCAGNAPWLGSAVASTNPTARDGPLKREEPGPARAHGGRAGPDRTGDAVPRRRGRRRVSVGRRPIDHRTGYPIVSVDSVLVSRYRVRRRVRSNQYCRVRVFRSAAETSSRAVHRAPEDERPPRCESRSARTRQICHPIRSSESPDVSSLDLEPRPIPGQPFSSCINRPLTSKQAN